MPIRVALIVEGHGEIDAAPILVRRIAAAIDPSLTVDVRPVLRVPVSRLMRSGELERQVEFAGRAVGRDGAILVLVDADGKDACPAIDGPALLARARSARSDLHTSVVLAKKEFESWFLAAAESLRGVRRLPDDLQPPKSPEEIRGAKEWLSRQMPRHQPYAETTDQAAMTQAFDMTQARTADSFDKCYREIDHLIRLCAAREMR